jgi:transposase-like protein
MRRYDFVVSMPEIGRLIGDSSDIELGFVDKEETPQPAMKLGIRLHLAGLSLADTVAVLADLGVDRVRSTVHNWRKKADLQPASGCSPDHVAVDETVIQLNDQRFWLYAAVDPATNRTLHARLFPARTIVTSKQFLTDLLEKHDVEDAVFLVDGAPWLQAACHDLDLRFHHVTHGNRNAVERVFKRLKRRTDQFGSHFRHASHTSAESWLQAYLALRNTI